MPWWFGASLLLLGVGLYGALFVVPADYQQGDTEGVVNYALSIQNVALAALFTERDDRVRVSLRSKGDFSVNEFARTHFNGGGHRNAAGGDIIKNIADTISLFESLLPAYSDAIHKSLENYK